MSNRVTDQSTQNALIKKYRLEGLLAEMSVLPSIVPTVNVGTIEEAQNTSEFEKWRSVFSGNRQIIDTADLTEVTPFWATGVTKVLASNIVVGGMGTQQVTGICGCALPGGSAAVAATDGVYRILFQGSSASNASLRGNIILTKQAAFGDPVALGPQRGLIGTFNIGGPEAVSGNCFDFFLVIRTSLDVNAVVVHAVNGSSSTYGLGLYVQKLIDEIPSNVIFP